MIEKHDKGFTLAEILITLGIIGIVAALTIPTISKNIQQAVLKNQFKKFYSTFWQAVIGIQTKEGRPINCYYWTNESNPYTGKCTVSCERDENGNCISNAICAETGQSLPQDFNGNMQQCPDFYEELFLRTLKTAKICKDHAYDQGCLPKNFKGANIVQSEQHPDNEYQPDGIFSDSVVKNNYPVYVLNDGTYIARHSKNAPLFLVDINGQKGPNKWGYDIFTFGFSGNRTVGIASIIQRPFNYATEKDGKEFQQMYDECFK